MVTYCSYNKIILKKFGIEYSWHIVCASSIFEITVQKKICRMRIPIATLIDPLYTFWFLQSELNVPYKKPNGRGITYGFNKFLSYYCTGKHLLTSSQSYKRQSRLRKKLRRKPPNIREWPM